MAGKLFKIALIAYTKKEADAFIAGHGLDKDDFRICTKMEHIVGHVFTGYIDTDRSYKCKDYFEMRAQIRTHSV